MSKHVSKCRKDLKKLHYESIRFGSDMIDMACPVAAHSSILDSKTRFKALYSCKPLFFITVMTPSLLKIQSKQQQQNPQEYLTLELDPFWGVVLKSAVCMF